MKPINEYILKTPLTIDDVLILHSGDKVLLNGEVYCARDATHRRMIADIKSELEVPFPLMNSTFTMLVRVQHHQAKLVRLGQRHQAAWTNFWNIFFKWV